MITLSTSAPCVLSTAPWPAPMVDQATFNQTYKAAQPLPLQPYCGGLGAVNDGLGMSVATATALNAAGYVVDVATMVWGWDPFIVMRQRLIDGYLWVPNAGQPDVQAAPGASITGVTLPYLATDAPVGAISVSLNLSDYPPIAPPQPAPAPSADLVGAATGTDYVYDGASYAMYNSNPGTDNGATAAFGSFTDIRGTFTKIVVPMGFLGIPQVFWILTAPAA
jgi:hypothetical protein